MKMIENLQINNYKSIGQLNLYCSRINVFIGEPNAGKSNILEALDLSYLPWLLHSNNLIDKSGLENISIKDFFRVEEVGDLFHLGDISKPISVIHSGLPVSIYLRFNSANDKNVFECSNSFEGITEFDNNFIPLEGTDFWGSTIKPYRFKDNIQFHDVGNYLDKLMPPFGNNLLRVIKYNASFRETIEDLIHDYGFEINMDTLREKFFIQMRMNKGLVHSIPYKAIADTFKRILFYTAAIRYNNASVITLDEPDAHAFPKYVSYLGDEIIKKPDCQFFISTHNPYLLTNLIENTPSNELSVFVCGYDKDKSETKVKKLSNENLSELLDYGVDIFFNINHYLDDSTEYSA